MGGWGGAIVVDGIVRWGLVKVAMSDGRCGMESSLKQALLTLYTPSPPFFQRDSDVEAEIEIIPGGAVTDNSG